VGNAFNRQEQAAKI
jgi:hypothetical protein